MPTMICFSRRGFALALVVAIGSVFPAWAQVRPTHRPDVPDFDHRAPAALEPDKAAERERGKTHLGAQLPSAAVDFDSLLHTPKFIRASDGLLTGPGGQGRAVSALATQRLAPNDSYLPIKAFLTEHSALFGHGAEVLNTARVKRDYADAHNGMRTVVWEQQLDGIPVFQSVLMGHITKQGELASLSSLFLPDAAASANAATPNRASVQSSPQISAVQAIVLAAQNLGANLAARDIVKTGGPVGDGGYLVFKTPDEAYARLVWLPLSRSALRLAWEVMVSAPATHERFLLVIDAITGEAHLRQALTHYISDATYNVYTSDSPSPFSPGLQTPGNFQPALTNRVMVTTPALDTIASPEGWIPDASNTTTGNNADAFVDRDFNQQPDQPRPVGNPNRVFDFPLDLTQDPTNYIDASTVQMFYWVNWYHDRLYQLGFTEAAGNYQENNFGRGGQGNDSIICYVQAGADFGFNNNAFFASAPDGINGQIAMFTWDGPTPDRDGDLDADVILHEATHGTSERLVGGGVLINALQTRGMGEGWSDFFALSLNSQPNDNPDAVYPAGGYASYRLFGLLQNYYYGIRHYPYCTDMAKNPFTFKDIDPNQVIAHTGVPLSPIYPFNTAEANEVHHQGEIWCNTLWEVRANLIHKYGYPGNQLMLQLVIDGMKLGPANPTFLQARDAILLADRVDTGGANALEIWKGFAKRGMGISATSPGSSTTIGVFEAFDLPGLQVEHTVISGGNGNGVIDFNECNNLQVFLVNNSGFAVSGISARLSSSTPGVIIAQPFSNYPDIPDGATNANYTLFKVSTAPSFICGTPIDLSLAVKSDQTTSSNRFLLTTGIPVPPNRFDNFTPAQIPDNDPAGTNSFIVVSNIASAISKVTVALHINHTFDGDLTLQLISPDGVTNTLSANNGSSGQNYGLSCSPDSQRTTFDDTAALSIASAAPPYVGAFIPDQPLSVFAGKSGTNVNGTWTLHVVDSAQIDVGTIQCWSLFFSAAQCVDGGGECPGADLAIGMVDQPDPVMIGNNLTYTISVTNNGPSTAKNVSVVQALPGSVTFVSATPSQGGSSQSGGVVTCNLGNLPARGRATIVVVCQPLSQGTISSTATVSSTDFDFDTSNNSVTVLTQVNPPTADLAVNLVAAPEPVSLGASLAYTVSVTNSGPSSASGVVVTNVLPASMAIVSASVLQGSLTITNNLVIWSLGGLAGGGRATATINATATAEGSFVATSSIAGNQFDPVTTNNTASFISTVGPSADLAIGIIDVPNPVILGSNFTYLVSITNLGPSAASSVLVNQTLPVGVIVVSTNDSQGVVSISGNTLSWDVGALASGARATMTLVLTTTASGTLATTVNISGSQPDPHTSNNSASITTLVSNPFVTIATAGATLTAENLNTNGAIDIGETVTVVLRLRDVGNVNATNVIATLLTNSNVVPTPPNNPQTYGALAASGPAVGRPFSFTANGTNGQTITATLRLQGGGTTTNIDFNFTLPRTVTFSNTSAIAIRDNTNALPYPSAINVSGLAGLLGKVTATLVNLSHTFPQDVDALLVGPSAQKTILMSGAGAPPVEGATVTFDDYASSFVPDSSSQIISGSYRPTNYAGVTLPPSAPVGPYPAAMSVFNTFNPNGVWSLYVADHSPGDTGSIAGGWSLSLTLLTPVNQLADLGLTVVDSPDPALAGNPLTYTFTVTNAGPNNASFVVFSNTLPSSVGLVSAVSSQGTVVTNATLVTGNLGPLLVGASATITVVVTPDAAAAGLLTNTASISASEIDVNPANSTVSAITAINLPLADLGLAQAAATNMVVLNSNVTYTIAVTNSGPGAALNVLVTDPMPLGLGSISASSSQGTVSNASGTIFASLGTIPTGSIATVTINATATSLGTKTNLATVSTASTDTNSANNSASVLVTVLSAAPNIIPAGAVLTSESFGPPNGTIDPGETVTVSLGLRNIGSANTSAGFSATLLSSGGVTPVGSAHQVYGALIPGGVARSNTFSFVASGANGGSVTATLQLQDGAQNLGTAAFTFNLPTTLTFSNTAAITIPDHGAGTPYPSSINVSGMTGLVSTAKVTLHGLSHTFPRDVNLLLVSPAGGEVLLMSHTGGGHPVTNLTLIFDDAAAAGLPQNDALSSGSDKPTRYPGAVTLPSPAPLGPYGTVMAAVNGKSANGVWSLYAFDDSVGDAGQISGGWAIELTTVNTVNPITDLQIAMSSAPASLFVGATMTNTINVTNLGPNSATGVYVTNTFPASVSLLSNSGSFGSFAGSGSGVFTWNVGSLAPGSGARIAVVLAPSLGATITNVAVVVGAEADLNPGNNTALTTTLVKVPAAPTLSGSVSNHQVHLTVTAEPGLDYIIQASTNLTAWVSLSTNTATAGGTIKFIDTSSTNLKYRFYRAKRQLP